MHSASQIIEKWPSAGELSRDLAVPYQTVRAWRNRGSIPPAYWRDLIRSALRRGIVGVTPESLVEAHARGEPTTSDAETGERPIGVGHFSRWRGVRRSTFATDEAIDEHVRALREEWARR